MKGPLVAELDDPVMIVVGGGAIALSTAQELCALKGHRVVVVWTRDPDFARTVEAIGAVYVGARPDSVEALDRAGVQYAVTILALSPDDQLNLHAALLARDANPRIRIVLRQFNRTLAHKIEQNLANCSVLSLAWHSAATYAAAAMDSSCFRGLQFPEPDGPLTGFVTRIAEDSGVAGLSIAQAERALAARIIAVDGLTESPRKRFSRMGRSSLLMVTSPSCKTRHPTSRHGLQVQRQSDGRGRYGAGCGGSCAGTIPFSPHSPQLLLPYIWRSSRPAFGIFNPSSQAAGSMRFISSSQR